VEGFRRVTEIRFATSRPTRTESGDDAACFYVELGPRDRWTLSVSVSCSGDGIPSGRAPSRTSDRAVAERAVDHPPQLRGALRDVERTYEQSLADLAALTLPADDPAGPGVPAAGLPWFMTLFGRDSLIASYQALPFMPQLARATLPALAALQAEQDEPFRDAEPGKYVRRDPSVRVRRPEIVLDVGGEQDRGRLAAKAECHFGHHVQRNVRIDGPHVDTAAEDELRPATEVAAIILRNFTEVSASAAPTGVERNIKLVK
jgi:hypothetical protein